MSKFKVGDLVVYATNDLFQQYWGNCIFRVTSIGTNKQVYVGMTDFGEETTKPSILEYGLFEDEFEFADMHINQQTLKKALGIKS